MSAAGSIDTQLGDPATRFFGVGYRRVEHSVECIEANHNGADFVVTVRYPSDWSVKRNGAQRTHLTSVDAISLVVTLTESWLRRLPADQRPPLARTWIRSCTLTPGAEPATDLAGVRVRLDVKSLSGVIHGWTMDCAVGSFTVSLALVAESEPSTASHDEFVSTTSYFAGAFRTVRRAVGPVREVDGFHTASFKVGPRYEGCGERFGIESSFTDSPSMLDAALFCAQIGQVALHALDGVPREATNTLWLRRAHFAREYAPAYSRGIGDCVVRITKTSVLERTNARWRTADLVGTLDDITVSFRLAHELPVADVQTVTV